MADEEIPSYSIRHHPYRLSSLDPNAEWAGPWHIRLEYGEDYKYILEGRVEDMYALAMDLLNELRPHVEGSL